MGEDLQDLELPGSGYPSERKGVSEVS